MSRDDGKEIQDSNVKLSDDTYSEKKTRKHREIIGTDN